MRSFIETTIEELNKLTSEEVNALDEEQFLAYFKRSIDLGNRFMVGAIAKGEPDYDDPELSYVYGTATVTLRKSPYEPSGWAIWAGGGLYPRYRVKPVMVNSERFGKEMKKRGVPDDVLVEFFQKVDEKMHLVD